MKKSGKAGSVFENIVIVAIILVLVQTFIDDFSILVEWSWDARRILIFTGFGFDLFFTIEFLTRLFFALSEGRAKRYFFHERGWIDLLASVPLLMLNSGPTAIAMIIGGGSYFGLGGFLNVLKVVKAVRIARILRLLRVLKIFKQIKYADSAMAQRHITKITTLAITVFVFSLFIFIVVTPYIGVPAVEDAYTEQFSGTVGLYTEQADAGNEKGAMSVAENSRNLLIVKQNDRTVYSRFDNTYYTKNFGPGDYRSMKEGDYVFFFDLREMLKFQSKDNLLFFVIIVILVLLFMLYYSPHFAITVTDPINVMRKGLQDSSYNLEVKVPELYKEDDIFILAAQYNEVYLPLKDRSNAEAGGDMIDLSMEDFSNLFDSEE